MRVLYNGRLFEAEVPNEETVPKTTPQDNQYSPDDDNDGEISHIDIEKSKTINPNIVIKRIPPHKVIYANIMTFIRDQIGDVDGLNVIKEQILVIDGLFEELAKDVASEYNTTKSKDKTNYNVRGDSTMRKIASMYRFFSYYIMKYDFELVEWLEANIEANLFNEKSNIREINSPYSNIDLDVLMSLDNNRLNSDSFNMLNYDTAFNKTLDSFFNDADGLVEELAKGPGLFTSLRSMMGTFKNGLPVEYNELVDGSIVKRSVIIPIGKTRAVERIAHSMSIINATINSIINVEAIRQKYIIDYKKNLQKLNFTQEHMAQQMKLLSDSIKNGTVNTVEDFNKLQIAHKKRSTTDKEKEELGNRVARMAKAYKFKVESVLNTRRGQ